VIDAYNPDRRFLLNWHFCKPDQTDLQFPDLYRRVGALLAREDGTEAEHAALAAELRDALHPAGRPRLEFTPDQPPDGGWSLPNSVAHWARIFNVGRATMRKMLKGRKVRSRKYSRQSYAIAVDDIPAEHRGRFPGR
jgi:hypothetical protein